MGIDAGFAIRSYFTGFAGVEMIFLQYGARQGNAYGSAGKAPGPGKIVAQLRRMGKSNKRNYAFAFAVFGECKK
jgi:hypothetical protein